MNLDSLTCIKIFEVSLQVVNLTWFNNNQKGRFEFEIELKSWYSVEIL
jgi:hypothetical protein